MSHRPSPDPRLFPLLAVLAAGAIGLPVLSVTAQTLPPPAPRATEPDDTRDGKLEAYLGQRGLDALLARHLEGMLERASGAARIAIAERLGGAYARILAESTDPLQRADTITKAGVLLDEVPAADTFDLRIALIKARYLRAEEIAEKARLHLVDPAEREAAGESMEAIAGELAALADQANRRVLLLERRERAGSIADMPAFRSDLAEARRQRSLANYYAGWSNYYDALLTGDRAAAKAALENFGFILNAEGRAPEVADIPGSLLRYEHVARAAIGVALCHGVMGEHRVAVEWLRAIAESEEVTPEILAQLFNRRVTILTGARRWDALARAVEDRRGAGLDQPSPDPLRVAEARLLAIEVLEALRARDADADRRAAAEPIVQCALSDLIARTETAQVLDLVDRYGTLPIGETGFIAQYVRGLRAYRAARDLHERSGEDATKPTRDPELVSAYLEAADLLAPAFDNPESVNFADERASAGVMLGMSLYYKDSPADAAQRFEQAARVAGSGERHAEALWMTVVSLEAAVENGRTDLDKRRKAAAALFVRTYPGTDRAARLLLRFADDGIFDSDSAVSILLDLDRSSPIYDAARAHIADTLYREYARSREPERSTLASRFLPVAMERIESGLRALRAGQTEGLGTLALRARQALDAALTPLATDPPSARRALAAIEEIRVRAPGALDDDLSGELAYRALQLAIAEGNSSAQDEAHRRLAELGGEYLDAADRFLFDRARAAWEQSASDADARRVVEIGSRLLEGGEIPRTKLAVADAVARAATALWESVADRVMLSAAIDLDRLVLAGHTPTSGLLRRLATNAEAAGEAGLALTTWNRLAGALPSGDPLWYEARYNSLRLQADDDPLAALGALRQHSVLYPEMGPAPWGDRLRALMARLESGLPAEGAP
jgi:hypothetical protein